jgi:hypothetical protein
MGWATSWAIFSQTHSSERLFTLGSFSKITEVAQNLWTTVLFELRMGWTNSLAIFSQTHPNE